MKWVLAYLLLLSTALAADKICDSVIYHGEEELELNENERNLVCGDQEVDAYKDVPAYQAQFFFTGFLQERGYLQPHFEVKRGVLHVHPGEVSKLNDLKVKGQFKEDSDAIQDSLWRHYRKRMLTPKLVDALEADGKSMLRRRGHACVKVNAQVDPRSGVATLQMENDGHHRFGELQRESVPGLHERALDRFYPFEVEDLFNERLLTLTEKRMLRQEVVQGTYFLENCGDELEIEQKFIIGPPRTLRYGVGASTEEGPMVRARWSNHRYKSMASLLSATVQASLREQSLRLTADSFFWKHEPRRSVLTEALFLRESQLDYEQLLFRLGPHMKWTADGMGHHWQWTLGPTFETGTYHTSEDTNTKSFANGVLEGSLQWMDHDYEFYDIHPEEGDLLSFNFGLRHPALGYSDPLLRLSSSYVRLKELAPSGRGTLIGGARLIAGTSWVSNEVSASSLPPNVKFYGGGSDDIRGFQLQTLPRNDGVGALSKLGAKLELRRTRLWKDSIEGFIFMDGAYFSERSWTLDERLYYSPGVGLRWLSPIGMVQGYAANGFANHPQEDLGPYLFIGLGGVF